ncbi:hypothetical protein PTKIN_Ptkin06aG0014400 [Pterospermum kingtungense]
MSMVPSSYFGGRSSIVHEPFYQQVWDPFQEFHYMSTVIAPPRPAFSTESPFELSKMDWKETPEAHVLKAHLPGVKKNQVKLEVEEGRVLCIKAEKNMEKEVKGQTWHRVERSSGVFVRRFRLPENTKMDKLTAYLENGVLTVTIPKEEAKHYPIRTIEIEGM